MRFPIAVLVLIHSFISCIAQDISKLEEVMETYTRQYKFNGAVLVVHKGKILLNKGYGYRSVDNKVQHDANSIFQIGSITKQFTTAVILKLEEEKKLTIKDKLSKYFSGYPKGDSITIEHLMTHTSGIYSYTANDKFMTDDVYSPSDRRRMMALFKDSSLQFSPGSKWSYSNSAYMLLGYIIEDITKMPYETAVRKYIFTKAGMTNSGFDFAHLTAANKSTGYLRLNETSNNPSRIVDSSVSYAAGSIYSTTSDLYKWFQALQRNSIISERSKQAAFTPQLNKYGYGWVIDTLAGKRAIGHSGGIFGFTSNMMNVPEDSTTVILLANMGTSHLHAITTHLYNILYDKPYELPKEKIAIVLSDDVLQQYTGVFELSPELIVTVRLENGKLIGQPEGQEALQLHPEKSDQFFLKEIDAEIKFNRNEKKEIISLTLIQTGRELTGKKR